MKITKTQLRVMIKEAINEANEGGQGKLLRQTS
jgi:hypothetical protein